MYKYIIYEDGSADVFSVEHSHNFVANNSGKVPISAGFVEKDYLGEYKTTGYSMTLNLHSNQDDIKKVIDLIPN